MPLSGAAWWQRSGKIKFGCDLPMSDHEMSEYHTLGLPLSALTYVHTFAQDSADGW